MAEQGQQQKKAKGKVVDKWKLKSWYSILAPEIFESREVGQLVASDEASLPNRVIRMSLMDLSGQMSQLSAFTSVSLRVKEVRGKSVATAIIGHELAPAFTRTIVRRRHSVIHQVDDVTTKDGVQLRIKSLALTANKASEETRTAVRNAISEEVRRLAKETEFNTLIHEILFGRFAGKVFAKIKKIMPMRRVEVRKSEVMEKFT